ncbi:hypothetical protein M8009_16310 [Halomonas sp. ATCH28]|uniref:AsmA-like C-terminal domain-containing protein n=1 Tax=Halomonas gemina TaxID=2945105 RepID=A0ABT0T645_9GAMM|nr:hypothetical protein [Halomonas gemina]MCL7941855.1 hypothetical protein [Halomonas gemina]
MQRPDADTSRRRRLSWLMAAPLLALALYLIVANGLINAPYTQAWLAEKTGISVRWASGWSAFPGHFVLEDLYIESEDPALGLAVDRARLRISLPALLERRLEVSRFTAQGLRRFSLGHNRLEGHGEVALSGLRLDDGRVSIQGLELGLEEARVRRGSTVLANNIRLTINLQVAPFRLREHPDLAAARFVSGTLSLDATADAWDVFTPYLRQLDWLDLAGHGRLTGELSLERGELAPGSDLRLDSPSLLVELDERLLLSASEEPTEEARPGRERAVGTPDHHRLSGAGRVTGRVVAGDEGPVMELGVTLDEMLMQRAGLAEPFMTSRRFRLSARLPGADLADAPRQLASARLEWEDARLPNVGDLAVYLPEGGPLTLQSGSARLEGYLAYRDGLLEGNFHLAGDRVALTLAGRPLEGSITLDLALPEVDPRQRRLDLTGTHLEVSASGEEDALPLTTEVTLEEARLTSMVPLARLIGGQGPPPLEGRVVLRGRVARLDVLDDFLIHAVDGGLTLEGGGNLAASLQLEQGRVASGSRLAVTTESLRARLFDLEASGRGSVTASWQEALGRPAARLDASLEGTRVARLSDRQLLMQEGRLVLTAESDATGLDASLAGPRLSLSWQDAEMPDVAVLQPYLPAAAPVTLKSGRAATRGRIEVEGGRARGQIDLTGQRITGRLLGREVEGELTLDLQVQKADLGNGRLDLSGSRLAMQAAATASGPRMRTRIVAREARLGPLPVPGREGKAPGMDGQLVLDGLVANLGFLDDFLPSAHGLTLEGSGRFHADLKLANDHLRPRSRFRVEADDLAVGFLDFAATGKGRLEAEIVGDHDAPGARMSLTLPRFSLNRIGEAKAHVEGRHFSLVTETPRFGLDPEEHSLQNFTTRIRLPIAEVDDLSRYNAYLPEDAGLALLGGRAGLEVDLHLEGLQARGDLTLQAFDTAIRLGEQHLEGDLRLEARLRDGNLVTRRFDASGSQLRLDNIQRRDEQTRGEAGWWARLDITEGRLDWTRPLQLDARIAMAMRDSGLLARLFLSRAREWEWLGRRLTVNDIRGNALLHLDDDTLQLREARLTGGPLEMLADLVIRDKALEGSLYARLGILAVGVSLEQGRPEVRLLRPRRWYERHRPSPEEDLEEVTVHQWQQALDTQARPSGNTE